MGMSNLIIRTYLKRDKPTIYKQADVPTYPKFAGDQAEYRQRMRILGMGLQTSQWKRVGMRPLGGWLLIIGILVILVAFLPRLERQAPDPHLVRNSDPSQNLYYVANQETADWNAIRSSHPGPAPSSSGSQAVLNPRISGTGSDQLFIPGSQSQSHLCFSFTYPFSTERVGSLFCIQLPGARDRAEQLETNMESVVQHLQNPQTQTLCTYGPSGTRCQ